ncbi:MAG: transporter [Phenylobacterium sp.]|jgi:EmrB/QacA subfamily drug resistance transporter|uniref:MFS transporter n=1 Tax=Phenylobacterium sp. TaxID=1871053 RepID=UPI00262F859C|nr:MFS transporter [Phenylobacterium sp.]MDB5434458.1 transporter [Phenylobacterium sp.]MDB5462427.1 transporter [Phenylobacterium sp.]MDB5499760.1 transporter [Phenylobacterium sp.]
MSTRAEEVLAGDILDEPGADAAAILNEGKDAALRGWVVPAIIGSALLMQTLNATSINNALPAMARALHVEPLRLNLAITMYLLASAVFLPISGWLADRFGAKRILMIAMVLYATASAACGFANSLPQLVAFRLAQGCAGAMMGPVGRLVLLRTTPKNELVGAMSVVTMPALLGPVVGPVLGGAIVTFVSWRWIFFLNLPIAIAGVALVRAFVPNVKEQAVSPIDWRGILLTGFGLAGLIFGFENLGREAMPPVAVAGLFAGGLACLGLYWSHARNNPHAIIDLSIFRIPTFQASVLGGAFFRLVPGATPFLLAMLLQVGFGMTAFAAGLMTFISAVGALVMKTTAPPILRRFGFRTVLIVNGVICSATFMVYALFKLDTPHWLIMVALAVGGFFRSLQFTSLNGMAYADLEQAQMSRGTTTASIAQQFMQSVSIGLAATLLHFLMVARGETHLTAAAVAPAFAIIGAATLLSLFWFLRLPADAGDEMNNRSR